MTAGQRGAGEQAELDGYGDVISRVRGSLGSLTTEELVRIRGLLEAALAGDRPDPEALAELARALARDA